MFNWLRDLLKDGASSTTQIPVSKRTSLTDRRGHVGGIESLTLDGVTYFFGFDYKADIVLSPLMASPPEMAKFASQNMLQTDGEHDESYWRELVDASREESELCHFPDECTFSSAELGAVVDNLREAERHNAIAPNISLSLHLTYLLSAAGDWAVHCSEIDEAIALISGEAAPENATISEVSASIQAQLRELIDNAAGNWSTVFSMLRP